MTQQTIINRIQALGLLTDQLATMRQSLLLDLAGNLYQCGQTLALVHADVQLQALGLRYAVNPIVWQGWATLLAYWQALGGQGSTCLEKALRFGYGIPTALREASDPHTAEVQDWHRALFSGATLDPEQPAQLQALMLNREVLRHIAQTFEGALSADTLGPLWAAIGLATAPHATPHNTNPQPSNMKADNSPSEMDKQPTTEPQTKAVESQSGAAENTLGSSEVEPDKARTQIEESEPDPVNAAPQNEPTFEETTEEQEAGELGDEPQEIALPANEEELDFARQLAASAMLAAYRLNHRGIAQRLRLGFLHERTATKSGYHLPRFQQLRRLLTIVIYRAQSLGLDMDVIRIATLSGKGNLHHPIRYKDITDSEMLTDEHITLKSTIGEVLGQRLTQKLNLHPSITEMSAEQALAYAYEELQLQAKGLKAIGKLKDTVSPVPNMDQLVQQWQQELVQQIKDLLEGHTSPETPANRKAKEGAAMPVN